MQKTLIYSISISALLLVLSAASIVLFVRADHTASVDADENQSVLAGDRPVRIALLNGCGRQGLAADFADALRERGYDVVNGQGDNADSFDFDQTVVVDRTGNYRLARRLADDLSIKLVISQNATDPYIMEDVEIILGRDWDTVPAAKEVP